MRILSLGGGEAPLLLPAVGSLADGPCPSSRLSPPPRPPTAARPKLVPKAATDASVPSPYASVRAALQDWRAIGASPWVLSTLRDGLRLPWRAPPPPYRARPIHQPPEVQAWGAHEIQRWVTRRFARKAKASEARKAQWAAASFVTDIARKPRLVVDLSHVNGSLGDRPFKYETLASFVSRLAPGDHMVSWDVSDAFHHVPLHPDESFRLAFMVGDDLYFPLSMPFGLKLAPWVLTKVLRPVLAWLRMRGFTILGYMDDFASIATGVRPGSRPAATAARAAAVALFRRLGIQIHPTKGAVVGTTMLDVLGFRIDTVRQLLLLPPTRLDKVVGAAHSLLRAAASHRRWVRLRALQRFCGLAVSCGAAIPLARFHLHALYKCLAGNSRRSQLQLSTAAMTETTWWSRLGSSAEVGRALWEQPVVAELTTDACGYGWGAVLNRSVPARGFFSLADQAMHINVQELLALDKALDCFPSIKGPGTLRIRLDSAVNVAVVNNMTSRSPALMAVLTRIADKLTARGLRAEATWLSSLANEYADRLSRDKDSSDWRLLPHVFQRINNCWGPCTIDRFATAENAHLPRFNSRDMSAGTEALDGWAQPWGGEVNFVNPPISQADRILPKIAGDMATAVVVLPEWPAMPWWRPMLDAASAAVYLPPSANLFTHGKWASPARRPSWRTAAFLIKYGGRPSAASLGATPRTPAPWPPSAP